MKTCFENIEALYEKYPSAKQLEAKKQKEEEQEKYIRALLDAGYTHSEIAKIISSKSRSLFISYVGTLFNQY